MIENQDEFNQVEAEIMAEDFDSLGSSDPEPSIPGEFMGADACGSICTSLFDVLASRKGEHWKLKKEESVALGGALDAVLAKYIPAGMDKMSAEVSLALVAMSIMLPRMSHDEKGAGSKDGSS